MTTHRPAPSGDPRSPWASLGAGLVLLSFYCAGCAPREGEDGLGIRVETSNGATPAPHFAYLAGDSGVRELRCPGATTAGLRCTASGLAVGDFGEADELTVKAETTGFATRALRDLQTDPLMLLPDLPGFEATPSYATGFARGDAEGFQELAAAADTPLGAAHILKFYISDFDAQPTLYLQNTRRYVTHFAFAQQVLGLAGTPAAFAAATYQGEDRKALAGTLTHYPDLSVATGGGELEYSEPFLLEFFPSDDLSPRLVLLAHRLIEERFGALALEGARQRLIYVPAGAEQESSAREATGLLAGRGALWAAAADVYAGVHQQILNPGLAYGTLRRMTPEQLASSPASFRDILVLTRLPNDLPIVGGTITEEMQTPLAHVNLLARARQTPNMALAGASEDERVAPLLDELVRFEVTPSGFSLAISTPAEAEAFYASRQRDPFLPERDLTERGLPGFEELGFVDYPRVGSKAANLAELHGLLPETAPAGFAVPFSAYVDHITLNLVDAAGCALARETCVASGRDATSCDDAASRCGASSDAGRSIAEHVEAMLEDAEVAQQTLLRDASLAVVRSLIETSPVDPAFASALDARVAELFGAEQVRLRSSTNVEDLPDFSGAGLYESFSAFATGEKHAAGVVRRVWACVWGFAAFEEREFWNVDPTLVAMGVAVNPAFDDELANGVIITGGIAPCAAGEAYVNVQLGEISVTNPEAGELAESLCITSGPGGTAQARVLNYSSLSPAASILSVTEIAELDRTTRLAHEHFAPLYGVAPPSFKLDLEFKLVGSDRRLVLKQARPFADGAP